MTVEVWRVGLGAGAAPPAGTLSPAERARAARFASAEHTRRWTVAHEALRAVLAARAGCAPAAVTFAAGEHGKPELAGGGPRFSLSHCDDLALIAVADIEVGVDVEPGGRRVDAVPRVLTDAELATLDGLAGEERGAALLRLWCRKEALAKAVGSGMRLDPDRLDTTRPGPYALVDLDVVGHTAALAAAGPAPRVVMRAFPA
jgi:4'-phosphopantetheinyl transferase